MAILTEGTSTSSNTLIGAVNETAPATDTASSGLNGRLQRIAQRLTSIIALLPAALGAGGGLKVEGVGTAGTPAGGVVTVQGGAAYDTLVASGGEVTGPTLSVYDVIGNKVGPLATPSQDGITQQQASGALRGSIAMLAPMGFNGATWDRPRTPTIFKPLLAVLVTAETTIWTPAAGKKFRIMGFVITQGVLTGNVTLRDNTAGTTILVIPAGVVGTPLYVPLGNGILSTAANNVLTAQGAATETISGFIFGTEE